MSDNAEAVKTCSTCGARLTAAAWAALPLIGTQAIEADGDEPAETFEVRNCACGSSLGLVCQ